MSMLLEVPRERRGQIWDQPIQPKTTCVYINTNLGEHLDLRILLCNVELPTSGIFEVHLINRQVSKEYDEAVARDRPI